MKKLLLITITLLLSLTLIGRHRELNPREIDNAVSDWILEELRDAGYTILPEVIVQDTLNHKKSNYEKYWEEKQRNYFQKIDKFKEDNAKVKQDTLKPEFDDLYYQPSKDSKMMKHRMMKRDTIQKTTIIKDPVTINNYYYDDNDFYYANRINRFHSGFWFDYYSPFYYPYYGWNSPYFYDSWYWGYNSWYGWNFSFGWHSPYYGWNSPYYYNWHTPYYGHNNFYGHYQQPIYNNVQYGRRERPSNFTQTNPNRRLADKQPQGNRIEAPQQRVNPQNRATYGETRRSYAPTYETPRMSTRPQYNNTRTQRSTETRTYQGTQRSTGDDKPLYTRPSTNNDRRSTYSAPQQRNSTTYSTPSRSSNSYNSGSQQRSSSYSSQPSRSSSSSFSNGGSSGASRSSGGSNMGSSGSGSSGGRSSGGSTSSGRR